MTKKERQIREEISIHWMGKGCAVYFVPLSSELRENLRDFSGLPEKSQEEALFDTDFYCFPGTAYKSSLSKLSERVFYGLLIEPRNLIEFRKNGRKKRTVNVQVLQELRTLFPLFKVVRRWPLP